MTLAYGERHGRGKMPGSHLIFDNATNDVIYLVTIEQQLYSK